MQIAKIIAASLSALALSACATTPRAGPAEVVSFVAPESRASLGQGTIFIESAPSADEGSLRLAGYKSAVARELAALGYREVPRDQADQIAQVRVERFNSREESRRGGPVSVGVGGSTGGYGSGVGLGIGINLGGNGPRETVDTELGVMIRDKASMTTLWEGRAQFGADIRHSLADPAAGADALAGALFSSFPDATGDAVIVELDQE